MVARFVQSNVYNAVAYIENPNVSFGVIQTPTFFECMMRQEY